jgi:hypothetical protein
MPVQINREADPVTLYKVLIELSVLIKAPLPVRDR